MSSAESHHRRRSHGSSAQPAPRKLDHADFWLIATICYWLTLLTLMHIPGESLPSELRPGATNDGWLHAAAYFVFSLLLCRTCDALHFRRYPLMNPPMILYGFILLGCILYGYLDEQTQPLTGRTADDADWQANILGAVFGIGTHLAVQIFLISDPAEKSGEKPGSRRRRRRHSHSHSRRRRRHRRGEGEPGHGSPGPEGGSSAQPSPAGSEPPKNSDPRQGDGSHGRGESSRRRRRRRRHRRRGDHRDGGGGSGST